MEQIVAGWLTDNLPSGTYPYVLWSAHHFNVARPLFILLGGLYVAFTIVLILFIRAAMIAILDRFDD